MTPTTCIRHIPPRPGTLAAPLLAALAVTALTACDQPVGGSANRAEATPKAMTACRQRADQVFDRQNPADVYRSDMYAGGQRDAPFGAGVPGNPSDGLSARYARETMVDDCLNGVSGGADASPPATTATTP